MPMRVLHRSKLENRGRRKESDIVEKDSKTLDKKPVDAATDSPKKAPQPSTNAILRLRQWFKNMSCTSSMYMVRDEEAKANQNAKAALDRRKMHESASSSAISSHYFDSLDEDHPSNGLDLSYQMYPSEMLPHGQNSTVSSKSSPSSSPSPLKSVLKKTSSSKNSDFHRSVSFSSPSIGAAEDTKRSLSVSFLDDYTASEKPPAVLSESSASTNMLYSFFRPPAKTSPNKRTSSAVDTQQQKENTAPIIEEEPDLPEAKIISYVRIDSNTITNL